MNEFKLGTRQFKMSKIDAFKQFHIARRISPILAEMLPAMQEMKNVSKLGELSEEAKLEQIAKFVAPIMMGLSKLSDADSEFVLYGLLASVEVQQSGGNWAPIARGPMLMIQEFELPDLLQIAGRAFMFNLSGFFGALPRQ